MSGRNVWLSACLPSISLSLDVAVVSDGLVSKHFISVLQEQEIGFFLSPYSVVIGEFVFKLALSHNLLFLYELNWAVGWRWGRRVFPLSLMHPSPPPPHPHTRYHTQLPYT